MRVAELFTEWHFEYPPSTYLAGLNVPDPRSEDWIRCAALFRITK